MSCNQSNTDEPASWARPPRRIVIVGNSGAGKSTLARRLSALLGYPHIELDALYHGPAWVPREQFKADVDRLCRAQGRWIVCGNYCQVRALLWSRADAVIWLDLSRRQVMRQLVPRTLNRMVRRTLLWNGNRERLRNLFRWDPELNLLRWAFTKHQAYVATYEAMLDDARYAALRFYRLRTSADVARIADDFARLLEAEHRA